MTVSYKIEPASIDDLDGILKVERACFSTPWPRSALCDEIVTTSWSKVKIVRHKGAIVGFMIFWVVSGELHLLNLAVLPEYRKRGIGRALVENLIKEAQDNGHFEILLEVRASNLPAQYLYTNFGFEHVGVRPGYYSDNGEDALVMSLKTS